MIFFYCLSLRPAQPRGLILVSIQTRTLYLTCYSHYSTLMLRIALQGAWGDLSQSRDHDWAAEPLSVPVSRPKSIALRNPRGSQAEIQSRSLHSFLYARFRHAERSVLRLILGTVQDRKKRNRSRVKVKLYQKCVVLFAYRSFGKSDFQLRNVLNDLQKNGRNLISQKEISMTMAPTNSITNASTGGCRDTTGAHYAEWMRRELILETFNPNLTFQTLILETWLKFLSTRLLTMKRLPSTPTLKITEINQTQIDQIVHRMSAFPL